jgi:DNA polymerase
MTLDPRRAAMWQAMSLGPLWQLRETARDVDASGAAMPAVGTANAIEAVHSDGPAVLAASPADSAGGVASSPVDRMSWPELQAAVAACTACGLCANRRQTVFGVGDQSAHWMLIGEAPGAEEDARGEPFVGQAGRLLDNMLAAVGLSRSAPDPSQAVYITNVLKCRPPGNRNPEADEVARCDPFLKRQVALVDPRIVLVMGRFAAQSLLGTDASIASLRGRVHRIEVGGRSVPVIVTYHPAYLLRNLADKSKSWADLCLARQTLAETAP